MSGARKAFSSDSNTGYAFSSSAASASAVAAGSVDSVSPVSAADSSVDSDSVSVVAVARLGGRLFVGVRVCGRRPRRRGLVRRAGVVVGVGRCGVGRGYRIGAIPSWPSAAWPPWPSPQLRPRWPARPPPRHGRPWHLPSGLPRGGRPRCGPHADADLAVDAEGLGRLGRRLEDADGTAGGLDLGHRRLRERVGDHEQRNGQLTVAEDLERLGHRPDEPDSAEHVLVDRQRRGLLALRCAGHVAGLERAALGRARRSRRRSRPRNRP